MYEPTVFPWHGSSTFLCARWQQQQQRVVQVRPVVGQVWWVGGQAAAVPVFVKKISLSSGENKQQPETR